MVHVAVKLSNTGEVLLSLLSANTRVQQVMPLIPELRESISKGIDPVKKGQGEIEWPLIGDRTLSWQEHQVEIEPGESDEFHFDFVVSADLRSVEVYSHIANVKKRGRDIGWGLTTLYDLQ